MHGKHDTLGTTWLSRTFGVTWMVALFAIGSMFATTLSTAQPEPASVAGDVGIVETSWIHLLGTETSGRAVPMHELRSATLNGFTAGDGTGIDVALIDTGVAPVDGLGADKVLHGPDLSGEGANANVAYLDTFGHGTHMAGIIAGDRAGHEGVAPGARLVSIKVAGADGITTVPQVVAAIDWVVEHANKDGLNIRVLNLSLGQSGVTNYVGDDLSLAVERAWHAGIFVVVAAGNSGQLYTHLDSPAIDPYVMSVGAVDTTSSSRRNRMLVPDWSARGNGLRNPDAVAPGKSVESYRVPGSTADLLFPHARVADDMFLGSGSSQAAAAVSGAAAAVLSANPHLDNDDLKASFKRGADDLRFEPEVTSGKGLVDSAAAVKRPKYDTQSHTMANGERYGSGNVGPTGATWSGGTWSSTTWSGSTWSGSTWSGGTWSGATWSGATWSGSTWSGSTWSGSTWSGAGWVR